jgi:hypothetical protein
LVPINSLDGADATWRQNVGSTTLTGQLAYGRTEEKAPGGLTTLAITNHRVVNFSAERGPFTARIVRSDAKYSFETGDFATPKRKISFTGAGLGMDWSNIVLQAEYGQTRGVGLGKNAWYVMGGYRIGKFVPFYNHGRVTGESRQTSDSLGVRWDAFRSAAVKFQVDRVKPEGAGMFVNVKPGFDGPVTIGAVSVDFVF